MKPIQAVIDMVKNHAPNVKELVVIGGSAGGVGIHVWAPIIAREFPQTIITAWSDSGLPWVPEDDKFTRAVNQQFKQAWNIPNDLVLLFNMFSCCFSFLTFLILIFNFYLSF